MTSTIRRSVPRTISASDGGPAEPSPGAVAASLDGVGVRIGGATLLDGVSLEVVAGRHLALLGPNGSGKTTILRVLATRLYPSAGEVEVLGIRFGRDDLRLARTRVGFVSVSLDALDRARARVDHLVAAAATGSTYPTGDPFAAARTAPGGTAGLVARVEQALARVGIAHLAERRVDTLSQGERQRVRIARALSLEPQLLLLDEPFGGMDFGGREQLVADLDRLLAEPDGPTVVLVTHHLEELPVGIADVALVRGGRIVAHGPVATTLDDDNVSAAFGLHVRVREADGRYSAVATP
jgi:iron complex transport system ATP-binding protein